MKKRFGAILAAGVLSCSMLAGVGLSGCGFAKIYDFEMPEGGYDGSKVTITFASTMGQNLSEIFDSAIERFNELYPNITVKHDNSNKNWETLSSNIATKFTTGKQPNLAYCYSDHVALYNESEAVLPLDDYFLPGSDFEDMTVTNAKGETEPLGLTADQIDETKGGYIKAFYEEGSVYEDGKTYTLPFAKSTEVLYYNQNFFTDNHLTVPTTWEEMEQTCKDILEIIGSDKTKYPLGYDSEANLFITLCEQYNSPYTSATGEHFLFNNNKNKEFVQMLSDWYSKGYFITKATNQDTYTSNLFTKEQCYMSIGSTGGATYQDSDKTDGEAKFTVGVARLPQVDLEHSKSILQGPSVCIFKKENPQEVLASWLLLKFLSTDIEFQGRFCEVSGYMPVTSAAYESESYQEFLGEGNLIARTAAECKKLVDEKAFYTSPAFTGSSKARERIGILMKAVLTGGNINDEFEKALKECRDFVG